MVGPTGFEPATSIHPKNSALPGCATVRKSREYYLKSLVFKNPLLLLLIRNLLCHKKKGYQKGLFWND